MKGNGIGRYLTVMAILVVVLFGLSVLAPLSNGPLANAAGASSSPAALTPATAAAATQTASASSAAKATPSSSVHSAAGPHAGTLQVYELAPGGAPTVDPAVAYYTVDDEPISNVYETLISFNGTDTGPTPSNWVPEVATCVPGSSQCLAETGNSLVYNNGQGIPTWYTFEISANAKFYDPATKVSWNVYPSDVLYSFVRTLMYANLPAVGYNNGWIQAQSQLPNGDHSWDSGIHSPYNNTPAPVFSSMLVNDSAYCPNPAGNLPINGCITFNLGASGEAWPYFLEMVSDPLGGSITPCGTFTALGAAIPGFYGTTAPHGDGPCLLPGNATSSTQAAFTNYVSAMDPTVWDAVQEVELTAPASPVAGVQYIMVGSGPYFATNVGASGGPGGSGGYTLGANPAYTAPEGCAGAPNCLPPAGGYIPNAVVYWDNADTLGIEEAISGQADSFGYDQTHTSTTLDLVKQGTYSLLRNVTTGNNWNTMFELTFNATTEVSSGFDSSAYTNVPGDFFANSGLRNFFVQAYPYTSIENTVWTVDGVSYGENYGGAIPPAQAFYYPTNVSWPGCGGLPSCSSAIGNPQTNPAIAGGAASWWQNVTNPASAWYDAEAAACTPSTPCQIAIQAWIGSPSLDNAMAAWYASVSALTHGAIQMETIDIAATALYSYVGLGNGQGVMPAYNWGWVPDYADPTDYMVPFWLANGTFSFAQGLYSTFAESQYNQASCGHTDPNTFADLAYWASQSTGIKTACQGIAYQTLVAWNALAAHESNITYRVLEYNMISQIGNLLAFEVYDYTTVAVVDYGSWLSPTGINVNPSVGGGGVQTWYTWAYADAVFQVGFTESGLPTGTSWSATLAGTTHSSTTPYINFTGLANSTYSYSIGFISSYGASPAGGNVKVAGSNSTVDVTFTAFVGPTADVNFTEGGLVSNTSWSMVVQNVGTLSSQQPTITFALPANATGWSYGAVTVVGYLTPAPGTIVTLPPTVASVSVTYTGVILTTYAINFASSGLSGSSWSVSLAGFTQTSTAANITFYETNATYVFTLSGQPSGYSPPAAGGQVVLNGADVAVAVPFTTALDGFALSFTETGLPTGAAWNVTINNFGIQSTGSSLQYTFPNGTYSWTVSTIGGWIASVLAGSTTINGNTPTVKVTFVQYTYAVTFFEGGLAPGAAWAVDVNGTTLPSSTYFLTVQLPNGTMPFTVPAIADYLTTPSSGNVTVAAAPATQVIIFGPIPTTYTVTFTAVGLPTGSTWTVYFGSQSPVSTTADTVSFQATNNTWTYAIGSPSGWVASPSGGTVTVNGLNMSKTVTFTAVSAAVTTSSTFSNLSIALIALFLVLAVIFLALALYWRGRKPPTAAPPQSWESSSTEKSSTDTSEGSSPPSS